ncbi:MAG TPA: haloacid dehalogenase [Acidimicrobiaceae bacterium]|nr:haloacid dehalogenase [Acidimicrobiaceae bacterium]
MLTLALDVDGVLLDLDRNGRGHWTNELKAQFGIEPALLNEAFFRRSWTDIVIGRRSVEHGLAEALAQIGTTADVESVLDCWFDADYVPIADTFELAQRAAQAGCRVVLATNQEHRRAAYLHRRIGASFPIDRVIYSADIGYQKHDPTFFEIASDLLGVDQRDRSNIVFVDDAAQNVDVARSAGWRAVHAASGQPWHNEVANLLELPPRSS